jgi:hypothetical protein
VSPGDFASREVCKNCSTVNTLAGKVGSTFLYAKVLQYLPQVYSRVFRTPVDSRNGNQKYKVLRSLYVLCSYLDRPMALQNIGRSKRYHKEITKMTSIISNRLNSVPFKKAKNIPEALPTGISKHDEKILTKVKRRAYHLDMSLFNCCGVR